MISPVTDGDGGIVLDRRCYPELGPEGGGEAPREVAEKLCALLGPEIRDRYPHARCGTSKRGPKIYFGEPVEDQDPTVDLVIALTRREGEGLWIPNLKKNTWEASDPERHAVLFNGGALAVRRTRRQVIRLVKAWNRQFSDPAFCSFHLSALALESVQGGLGLPAALGQFFADAAGSLRRGNTADPAGVSPPIRLRVNRDAAIARLDKAAEAVTRALEHDDDLAAVQASLAIVFWDYIESPEVSPLASAVRTLRPRTSVTTTSLGLAGRRSAGEAGQGLRRRHPAVTGSPAWQRPAWYAYPAGRLRFLAELRACGVHAVQTRIDRTDRKHRGGFQVKVALTVPGLPVPARSHRIRRARGRPVRIRRWARRVPSSLCRRVAVHVVPLGSGGRALDPPRRGGRAPRVHHGPPAARRMVAEDQRMGRRRGAARWRGGRQLGRNNRMTGATAGTVTGVASSSGFGPAQWATIIAALVAAWLPHLSPSPGICSRRRGPGWNAEPKYSPTRWPRSRNTWKLPTGSDAGRQPRKHEKPSLAR